MLFFLFTSHHLVSKKVFVMRNMKQYLSSHSFLLPTHSIKKVLYVKTQRYNFEISFRKMLQAGNWSLGSFVLRHHDITNFQTFSIRKLCDRISWWKLAEWKMFNFPKSDLFRQSFLSSFFSESKSQTLDSDCFESELFSPILNNNTVMFFLVSFLRD